MNQLRIQLDLTLKNIFFGVLWGSLSILSLVDSFNKFRHLDRPTQMHVDVPGPEGISGGPEGISGIAGSLYWMADLLHDVLHWLLDKHPHWAIYFEIGVGVVFLVMAVKPHIRLQARVVTPDPSS